jgi:cyclic pyranopterin phosphate synthase
MPEEGIPFRDKKEFMSQEELFQIVDVFVNAGITKIRLTGGEPLIKKNFSEILAKLSNYPVELNLTTNGILLDQYWAQLQNAGLKSLNISLDSLKEAKFNEISRRSYFQRIYRNIFRAVELGFKVKLNVVLMRGQNENEIIDFIELSKNNPFSVRFIEFMPFDNNQWDYSRTISSKEILDQAMAKYGRDQIEQIAAQANATSNDFKIKGYQGEFGIISSITNPFCDSCNRIRLTADGKIKNCLFSNQETDLLSALRQNQDIQSLIEAIILKKHKERAGLKPFDAKDFETENRSMTAIGG